MSLRHTRTPAAVALATLGVLAVSACSADRQEPGPAPAATATSATSAGPAAEPEQDPASQTGTGTKADPAPAPTTATTTKPRAALADGRWPAFLTGVGDDEVTVDLVEFLTGDKAAAAWQKKNPGSDEVGPPNDYYIVNDNTKKRVLPVTGAVAVRVVGGVGPEADTPAGLADLADKIPETMFWFTVKYGAVTRIEQQYLP